MVETSASDSITTNAPTVDSDFLSITPLGSGNEVGRSCHILKYKGKTIMLDCGIHPAGKGLAALPYFDEVEADTIDILLISHFHLDHAAALPYFLAQTNFKGRVFMTHPTKSIYKLILQDYVKVSTISSNVPLYDDSDLLNSLERIETVNFHEVVQHKGIKFRCYHAGHVLGAAMFLIEIAGVKVLYTGDYSRQEDRHLMGAETPEIKPDVLIIESTWGIRTIPPIGEREKRFTDMVHQIIKRGGRVLIPVFALGRAQELLLILDEYWEANPSLQSYPIYYASALAKKCMTVYRRYINMMNESIRSKSVVSNPFNFRHVLNLKGMEHFDDIGPSVVMASPGMLQNGLSRQLFELWCSDRRNGCVLAGYCVEGTLAKHIQSEPSEIATMSGLRVPLKMSVHEVSFSAHADFTDTRLFIETMQPLHVVLVHGEKSQMMRLKQELTRLLAKSNIQFTSPRNCQTVELEFRSERMANVIGQLSKTQSGILKGLLVRKDFNERLMAVDDLANETPLSSTAITQTIKVPFLYGLSAMKEFVERMYVLGPADDQLTRVTAAGDPAFKVMDEVTIIVRAGKNKISKRSEYIELNWQSNPLSDMIADSLMCILLSVETSVASASVLSTRCDHGDHHAHDCTATVTEHRQDMQRVLSRHFKHITFTSSPTPYFEVDVDGISATIHLTAAEVNVECDDESVREMVEGVAQRAHAATFPLAPSASYEQDEEFYDDLMHDDDDDDDDEDERVAVDADGVDNDFNARKCMSEDDTRMTLVSP